jgi:hypothetical protein
MYLFINSNGLDVIVNIWSDCALNVLSVFLKIGPKMNFDMHPEKFCMMTYYFVLIIWKRIESVMFCFNLNKFSIVQNFLLQLLCLSWGISLERYFLCKYELLISSF